MVSGEQAVLEELKDVLALLRDGKPEQRSEYSRHWAVAITEMEKVVAYFKVYVVDGSETVSFDKER